MSSFTSASQHYADYRDMPMVVHPLDGETLDSALEEVLGVYEWLIDVKCMPPEEARQILPNAAAVNLIWTVNARSLANFFEQRLCKRNTAEMVTVAAKIWDKVSHMWPEYAQAVGPACYMYGKCNQGKMSCGEPYSHD